MFTIGSTVEGISPSNPNIFARRLSCNSTQGIQVAKHAPDSSVSGEIELSEDEVSERPIERQNLCSVSEKPTEMETPFSDPSNLTIFTTVNKR
jgi:hypothetical protein